jgi:hypothetical protein
VVWSSIGRPCDKSFQEALAQSDMPVRFHRAAVAEAVAARDWYECARQGLGAGFAAEVERVVNLIQQYSVPVPFSCRRNAQGIPQAISLFNILRGSRRRHLCLGGLPSSERPIDNRTP